MSGCAVFQAYDGQAAEELCRLMPDIDLLVLNTEGTGMNTPGLVQAVRRVHPGLPVLHIGKAPVPGMSQDVVDLPESFSADQLLTAVRSLLHVGAVEPQAF